MAVVKEGEMHLDAIPTEINCFRWPYICLLLNQHVGFTTMQCRNQYVGVGSFANVDICLVQSTVLVPSHAKLGPKLIFSLRIYHTPLIQTRNIWLLEEGK